MKTHASPHSFFKHNLRMAKANASYMNHSGSKEEKKKPTTVEQSQQIEDNTLMNSESSW